MTDTDTRDRQQDLQRAKEVIAGPVPLMAAAPDCLVELPRGLYRNGSWQTLVEVRELTGADEEALSRLKETGSFFDAVIAYGVTTLGEVDVASKAVPERQALLQELLIGERDLLFLAVVKATFGENREIAFRCSSCQAEQEVTLLLSEDFKPQEVTDPLDQTFSYTTTRGVLLEIRLVVGSDQIEALSRKGATNAEQNTVILSRVIVKAGEELILNPMQFARTMSIRDREALLKELVRRQPSIDLGVTTNCSACGNEQRLNLSWWDIFRP